jgi:hypothetical protein
MERKLIHMCTITLLAGLCVGFVIGFFMVPAASQSVIPQQGAYPNQTLTPTAHLPTEIISYLFVQEAAGGSLVSGKNGTMTLTLNGVRDDTVYFSDRPARVSGVIDTNLFVHCSMFSGNNPPNAALMIPDAPAANDTVILTISNPQYDKTNGILTYTAAKVPEYNGEGLRVYQTFADPGVPETFDRVMLFIDNSDLPVNVFSNSANATEQDILVFH